MKLNYFVRAVVLAAVLCSTGCLTRTVAIDSQRDVVRLGPNVRGRVYVWRDGEWRLSGSVKLPEGWYAGPGPGK